MDHRQTNLRPAGIPSKASDREKAAALRNFIDAALAIYAAKGGTQRIIVQKVVKKGPAPLPDAK